MRILILGGTTEATALGRALAGRSDVSPVLSLAGRTAHPAPPPVPHRIGGFGGIDGLAAYLEHEGITAVVDATHPFASRISAHAAAACTMCRVPLVAFTRPPWRARPGDDWTHVPDLAAAAVAIGKAPRRVLLTVGRLGLAAFLQAPQHIYLIRTIDPPEATALPRHHALLCERGPFRIIDEVALMRRTDVDTIVTKNSGGTGAAAKLDAARTLGLRVIVVERPSSVHDRAERFALSDVLGWIKAHQVAPAP